MESTNNYEQPARYDGISHMYEFNFLFCGFSFIYFVDQRNLVLYVNDFHCLQVVYEESQFYPFQVTIHQTVSILCLS